MMLPWVHEESNGNDDFYGLAHYANDTDLRYGLSVGLLVVGAFMVLMIRAFGVFQLAGALLFLLALKDDFSSHNLGYVFGAMSSGFYLALVGGILGTASAIFKHALPVSERFLTLARSRAGRAYRVNFLSIAAATLGIVCVFLPWIVEKQAFAWSPRTYTYDWTLFSAFSSSWMPFMMSAAALFLFGSAVSFVTPLGGIPQFIGVLMYINGVVLDFRDFHSAYYGDSTLSFGFGLLIGLGASIAAIASLAIPRRLLISARFFSIRPEHRGTSPESTIEIPPIITVTQMPWTLRRTLRLSLLCAVVFGLIATPIAVAYAASLSEMTIQVYNGDQELTASVVVYVDDGAKWTLAVPPASQVARSVRLHAGEHNVAIDYAIPGRTPENAPDGKIDWSTSIKVKPLIGANVIANIGYYGSSLPIGDISVAAGPSRAVVTFDGFTQYVYGGRFSSEVSWSDIALLLTDGTYWTSWTNLTRSNLVSSIPPAMWHYGHASTLGSIDIWLNVTDLAANGYANKGDYLTLETGNGTFDPSTVYTLYVIYDATNDVISEATF